MPQSDVSDYLKSLPGNDTATQPQPSEALPASGGSVSDYLSSIPGAGASLVPGGGAAPKSEDESDRFTQKDPSDNWLDSGWKWLAEKPLTETLFGWGRYRQGAGGLERGAEKFLTGMTTPLSLGLLAAFAPAGIIEGVAGNVLKEGLTEGAEALGGEAISGLGAAAKVGEYSKAVDAARKAQIAGQSIEGAVQTSTNGSLTYPEFLNYGQYLRANGLKETDMLSESLARRVAAVGLRKVGLNAEQAQNIAKGAEVLVNAGFGLQQVQGAIYAYPRLMDALQQKDYDKAGELLVQAGTGTIFGGLGIAGTLHTVPEIFSSLNETRNLPLSDATEAVKNLAGIRDGMETKALVEANTRARSQLRDMMELAGIRIPDKLKQNIEKPYLSLLSETVEGLQEVLRSKEDAKKLADQQMTMFFSMSTGNDRTLALQSGNALANAFHLDDFFKQLTQNIIKPERSIEDIQKEQQNDILRSKVERDQNSNQLDATQAKIDQYLEAIKTAEPEAKQVINEELNKLTPLRDRLSLEQDRLDKEYDYIKQWKEPEPTTDLWFDHYKKLYNDLNEAAKATYDPSKPGNNVDEFNEKVRSMGWNPQDLFLIEKRFPQFRGMLMPQKVPVGELEPLTEMVYLPETGSFKGFRDGKVVVRAYIPKEELDSYIGPKAADQLLSGQLTPTGAYHAQGDFHYGWYDEHPDTTISARIHEVGPSSDEIGNAFTAASEAEQKFREGNSDLLRWKPGTPKYLAQLKEVNKRLVERGKANDLIRKLDNQIGGNVNQLPDGTKILYATTGTINAIHEATGEGLDSHGYVMPAVLVRKLIGKINSDSSFASRKEDLLNLIKEGKNSDGSLTVVVKPNSRRVSLRLGTLREELVHKWQHSLKNGFSNHLPSDAIDELFLALPKEVKVGLANLGYNVDPLTFVIEASAKMLAKPPDYFGLTPEQQAAWLNKYFEKVKNRYGEKAFDTLTHITTKARDLKEKFLNATRSAEPRQSSISRPSEGIIPSVGGAGGSGYSGGPPQPPSEEYPFQWSDDWRKKFPPSTINGGATSGFPLASWQDSAQHRALPADLIQRVDKARGQMWKSEDEEYIKRVLQAYAAVAKGLNEKESAFYQTLRDADDQNWTVGYNKDLIHSIVDNHIRHIWGDDSDVGHDVRQTAASGGFSTNVVQARHRVYSTALEGLLRGKKLAVHDPVSIIQVDANNIAKAAANKFFLDALIHRGYVDPEGMPMLVMKGMGSEVPGEGNTKAALLVNPDKVRNIHLTPGEISALKKAGLLDTYVKDGRLINQTPHVDQTNVKSWIDSTKKRIDTLIHKNPLLPERQKHEAGWDELERFTKGQASKIASYLSDAIKRIEENGPRNDGNYAPVPFPNNPYFAMSGYNKGIITGTERGFITAGDLDRLKKYASRNWKYALGESSFGEKGIRPSEVSKLIQQEQQFLSPELKKYIDENHDLFATNNKGVVIRTPDGKWTLPGLTTALKYIHHAAKDPEYPQLVRDMSDLKYVDNVLTSEPNTAYKPWRESDPTPSLNPTTQAEYKAEAEQRLKDINDRQEKKYLWAPKSHITIDHPAFHGWNWMATAKDGTPTLAKSDMAVSRFYYKWMKNRLGLEPSALRANEGIGKIASPILNLGAQAKTAILSGSPFHVIQEMLRAAMLWTNPFVRPNPIAHLDEEFQTPKGPKKLLQLGVQNGLTIFADRKAAEDYSVGVASHGGLISKIPVYGKIADQIHDYLFNRLIPTYKANGFKKMFNKYAEAHPDWTDEAIAKQAATHVNNAFGGQNWREMGRSATTQDWFHLIALAPDWLESEMRFASGLFRGMGFGPAKYEPDQKNFTRNQVLGTAAALWTTARLLNLLYSGNAHYETPFGLATKDKDGREIEYSVRTMPTDILHMASDPAGFLIGRESPFIRTGLELYTGRNQYGQKLTDSEKYVDLVSNLVPIWGQAGLKQVTHLATSADVGTPQQIVKAAGATAQVYRTPAQKTAANLASERSEEGSMNPAKIARHRTLIALEDQLREGKITSETLTNMVDYGNLPIADAKAVVKNVKETAGEDPETARMYSRVSRLDFAGAVSVWDDSNPKEKEVLQKLIIKKAKAYLKKARTDFTPEERIKDPLIVRARQIAPALETTNQ